MPTMVRNFPRDASLTLAISFANWSPCRNAVTGTASLVSLSIITAMPVPQFGWQPQLSWPQSLFLSSTCIRSAQSLKVDMKLNREPVAGRFAQAGLTFHVVREMRQRVALRLAAIVGDGFVASGKADRLE